jgi:uncharacterized protein (TIGR03032 family)
MSADTPADTTTEPQPLRSVHTDSFPALLEQLGISLVVTTYQAHKLVILRSRQGVLNAHFTALPRPMGLAADPVRLAVGTQHQVRHYRNMTPLPSRLKEPGRYDACYLPRGSHITGDIDIHEMAWAGDELWFVSARFSCLCTLDGVHSFVPRWRPPFTTALAAEDRCHLNGLCWREEAGTAAPSFYVTALAATDTPEGWRPYKAEGGLLLEAPGGAVVAGGLSMPHSPRLYGGRLWLLESGAGGLGFVDPASGRYECVAELPGFTRGLDFAGNLAFVGLSQVRDSALFSGIAVAERGLAERACGVWVVDSNNGRTVALLRFEGAVQEIFAVGVLGGLRYPELTQDSYIVADSFDLPLDVLGQFAQPPSNEELGDRR